MREYFDDAPNCYGECFPEPENVPCPEWLGDDANRPEQEELTLGTLLQEIRESENRTRVMARELALHRVDQGLNSILSTYFPGEEMEFEMAKQFVETVRELARNVFFGVQTPQSPESDMPGDIVELFPSQPEIEDEESTLEGT